MNPLPPSNANITPSSNEPDLPPRPAMSLDQVMSLITGHFPGGKPLIFTQDHLIELIREDPVKYQKLNQIIDRYGGICDLICNQILIEDTLDKPDRADDFWDRTITLESINSERIRNSHVVSSYSIFDKMMAIFFNRFPDNILSPAEQSQLVSKVKFDNGEEVGCLNPAVFNDALAQKVKIGEMIKVEIFCRDGLHFEGHSMLLKKTGDNKFTLFDPDGGEFRSYDFANVALKINSTIVRHQGFQVLLMRGDDFRKRIQKES